MAQISSISNGEAMSSVRTKLNDVITNVNLLDPTGWVDYSATSTIVGWSSFTTKIIKYRIIGKQMFVMFRLQGTSNSTSTSFTLPLNNNGVYTINWIIAVNNGSLINGNIDLNNSSNLVVCSSNFSSTWINTGSKQVFGQFFVEIA